MLYSDDIDAWYADDIDKLECPQCKSKVHMSWNECPCGMELNVEKIVSGSVVAYVMTIEHDDMVEFNEEIQQDMHESELL